MSMRLWSSGMLVLCVLFLGTPLSSQENTRKDIEKFVQQKHAENGRLIYLGEGMARFAPPSDIVTATQEAREAAQRALSETIRAKIRSTVTSTLVSSLDNYEESIQHRFERKIETYSNAVVERMNSRHFTNYPQDSTVTYLVWIDKARYEEEVERDIRLKKASVTTSVQQGNKEFSGRDYMAALNDWIVAKQSVADLFEDLPVEVNPEPGARSEEVSAYLMARVIGFFGKVKLTPLEDTHYFDVQGRMAEHLTVTAQYVDGNVKSPIAGLPIKVEFLEGIGTAASELSTDNFGQVKIPIKYVDPSVREAVLRVRVEAERIPGMEIFQVKALPYVRVPLTRVRTAALMASFQNVKNVGDISDMRDAVSEILRGNGFSVVEVQRARSGQEGLQRAMESNADYLVAIQVSTTGNGKAGSLDLYYANCAATVTVYELPGGEKKLTSSVSAVRGVAASPDGAGWQAYGKLKSQTISLTRDLVRKLK